MSLFCELASAYGFRTCYVLRPDKFIHYERRLLDGALYIGGTGLSYDPASTHPWANALLACIWPYAPFTPETPLCSNYAPANASFHAAGRLLTALGENGVRAERVYVPVRELLLRSGLGVALLNGLTAIPPFGSRFAIQTLAAFVPEPVYDDAAPRDACASCGACIDACPAHAIDKNSGFDYRKCLRAYMGKEAMPDWVMENMTKMLGCERCQNACPYNAGMDSVSELPASFSYERLLRGELRGALELVGFNQKSGGRLIAHAAVMAANEGRADLLPLIEAWRDDPREAVRAAEQYAISKLHNGKTMV